MAVIVLGAVRAEQSIGVRAAVVAVDAAGQEAQVLLPLKECDAVALAGDDRRVVGEVEDVAVGGAEGGEVVNVADIHGNFVGQALFSDASEITLRLLTQTEEPIDREWWRKGILAATARRQSIATDTNAYRMVYSEGDLLPSLIIDRYDDVLVMQTLAQGCGIAASPLIVFLPASTTIRVGVGRLVTVVSTVRAGAKSTW